ncbi:hypothetical protein QE152_g5479 [Popillia japonica]|uniref:Uncharacterized protein n=1 Tax=Popillia japonica TaxID=7064 RepID=A0AAW1ML84_POPJA
MMDGHLERPGGIKERKLGGVFSKTTLDFIQGTVTTTRYSFSKTEMGDRQGLSRGKTGKILIETDNFFPVVVIVICFVMSPSNGVENFEDQHHSQSSSELRCKSLDWLKSPQWSKQSPKIY